VADVGQLATYRTLRYVPPCSCLVADLVEDVLVSVVVAVVVAAAAVVVITVTSTAE